MIQKITVADQKGTGSALLTEDEAKELISEFEILTPHRWTLSKDLHDLDSIPNDAGPFVVKIMSREIVHKSDGGFVALNLQSRNDIRRAAELMANKAAAQKAYVEGFLVEQMVPAGVELVVGGFNDPSFGPIVMVGLGGIFVEVLKDVSFRLCPLSPIDAQEMLDELKCKPILDGARGQSAVDLEGLCNLLMKIGGPDGLLMHRPDIAELDLNPVIANETGLFAVDARIRLCRKSPKVSQNHACENFDALFHPRSIAVVGASATGRTAGNRLLEILDVSGFDGTIHVIHPRADEISGHKTLPALTDLQSPVDYAFVCVAAEGVPRIVREAKERVRFMQVMTSGFGESVENANRNTELQNAISESGIRLIGPNCIGMHSGEGRVSFVENAEFGPGKVAVVSQSGGLSIDIVRRGLQAGVSFHSVLSIGNAIDLDTTELLRAHLSDDTISAVGLYIETIENGRAFFKTLSENPDRKPVIILKGGRTSEGQRAAASHTGSIASDERIWDALARQTGVNIVDDLDEFLNLLLLYQLYTPIADCDGSEVILFGNGGGASVLASDHLSWNELSLYKLDADTLASLEAAEIPAGSSMENPMDVPANAMSRDEGKVIARILNILATRQDLGAFVMHLNLTVLAGYNSDVIVESAIAALEKMHDQLSRTAQVVLVLRTDRTPEIVELSNRYRRQAVAKGIAVFDDLPAAARALGAFKSTARFKRARTDIQQGRYDK